MTFKLHRIVCNTHAWQKPSPGRFHAPGVGGNPQKQGFGLEDWNFNLGMADADGWIYGFTQARWGRVQGAGPVNVMMATYEAGRWSAVGCYLAAERVDGTQIPQDIRHRRANDIRQMAPNHWDQTLVPSEIIMNSANYLRSKCTNIRHFPKPVPLPPSLSPKLARYSTSYNLAESDFYGILDVAFADGAQDGDPDFDPSWPEGRIFYATHRRRERNPAVVQAFKASLASFACSCCGFDFRAAYGELGSNYIEAHHTIAVSDMPPGHETKLADLIAVCANCHRMIHRQLPMLTQQQIRQRLGLSQADHAPLPRWTSALPQG